MGLSIVERRGGLVEKLCALTFDDGPAPWTAPILDLLRDYGSLATFFVIGEQVRADE